MEKDGLSELLGDDESFSLCYLLLAVLLKGQQAVGREPFPPHIP